MTWAARIFLLLFVTDIQAQAVVSRQVTWENDKWAFRGEDWSYTNGIRMEWRTANSGNTVPGWLRPVGKVLYGCSNPKPAYQCSSGAVIGQNFYTPDSVHVRALQDADRPYGGLLYGGVILAAASENVMFWTELDIGVVGDLSMAESTQKGVHKIVHATHPEGWDNQLGFEIAGVVRQSVRVRVAEARARLFGTSLRWLDLVPFAEGALGTSFTHLEGGAQLRAGHNLTNAFLSKITPVILVTSAEQPPSHRQKADVHSPTLGRLELYGFISIEGRVVGRNLFLQGSTFSSSHSVTPRRTVGTWAWGAVLRIHNVTVGYQRINRGREFMPGDRVHPYGSFAVSWSGPVCRC